MFSGQSGNGLQGAILAATALTFAAPAPAAAEFLFKKGSFLKSDNTAVPVDQSVAGVGFQPKAVIFFYTRQLAMGVATDVSGGWGLATGPSNERAIATGTADAQVAPASTHRAQSITNCIIIITSGALGTLRAEAEFVQFLPDGFQIRWTTNEARQDIIHYVALGGSDITNAVADHFAVTAGTGIQSVPVGFQPDYIMILSARMSSVDVVATDAHHSIGFATSPTARAAIGAQMEHQDPGRNTCVWQRTDSILLFANGAGNICPAVGGSGTERFDLSAFTPTGFDVNKVASGLSGEFVHYLALKGGRYRVGNFPKNNTLAAPPDVDQSVTGVSFRPVGVMLTSDNLPPIGPPSTVQAEGRISFGASDLASNGATWWHDRDGGLDPSDSNMRTSTTQIAVHASGVGGATVNAAGFLKSFDPDGFTLTWTANNTGAGANHEILYAAFGDSTNYRSIGTAANYTTGTVNATFGSRTVTGAGGTAWSAANRGRGDRITIPCPDPPTCTGGVHYTIFAVNANAQLTLTTPFPGTTGSYAYMIARQFVNFSAWEDCIDGPPGTACPFFPVTSQSLVTDNRNEVGIAYKDSVFTLGVVINGANTDAAHTITVTADPGNRHHGIAGNGVVIDNGLNVSSAVEVRDDFVTVDWLEIKGGGAPAANGVFVDLLSPGANANQIVLRQNLIHNVPGDGIEINDPDTIIDAYNNIIYRNGLRGIRITPGVLAVTSRLRILNNTLFNNAQQGVFKTLGASPATVHLRNNISHSNGIADFAVDPASIDPVNSSNNLASDTTATTHSPAGGGINSVPLTGAGGVNFVSTTASSENLHLLGTSRAINNGADLSAIFTRDIDNVSRLLPWEIGADDTSQVTAVTLMSFEAAGLDSAVELRWQTGSELNNLGFHLYRSTSAGGPYERITATVIPGLGSSPEGASYGYVDSGIANGVTYFYSLEDIETNGKTERHGPVAATPQAGAAPPPAPPADPGGSRISYGDAAKNGLRVTRLGPNQVLLELLTEGLFAIPQANGSVRIEVPGFEGLPEPGAPSIPTRRTWVEAVAGLGVRLGEVQLSDVTAFPGLRPVAGGLPDITVRRDGTVHPVLRKQAEGLAFRRAGLHPEKAARLLDVAFQGEVKKALLELSPLRWDSTTQQLLLAKRLSVRVVFSGVQASETSFGGSRGRRKLPGRRTRAAVRARLVARERGLYGARFEDVFGSAQGIAASRLRLSRGGEAVAFHVEPDTGTYGPGSVLYFVSEGSALNPWGTEAVYEVELGAGAAMPVVIAAPYGAAAGSYWKRSEWEQNKNYHPGLLEARSSWLWDDLVAPETRSYAFTLTQLASSTEPSHLTVWLEGASDFEAAPDHHVRVSVNGVTVGETSWDGKRPGAIEAEITPGLLREGVNQLEVESVGDTGAAYSYVFLDKFSVTYPRRLEAEAGVLWGSFSQSGWVEVSGVASALVVDTTAEPMWVRGAGARFAVEGGRSYLAVEPSAVRRPEVRVPLRSGLRGRANRADYLLIGPRELLTAAEPLLERRRSQGLLAKAVAVEDVYEEFGHGEASPSALKEFLAYAYHDWRAPSVRYVILFGDGSYDFKGYVVGGKANRVLPLLVKTTYLWTASDPSYGAVNGQDALPDVAVGRLPASSLGEAQALVAKVLAFEDSGQGLSGRAVLVADNPDSGGNFEVESEAIAGLLNGREVERIYISDSGPATRAAIADAFNRGSSLMSYVGHGGVAVWASENVFNNWNIAQLLPQAQQPFLMTMNCLNGFFHGPILDSLGEALVKAPDKGAIAAFSPSGLSIDAFAHEYEKALIRELESGRHERLGDAVLAAQVAYADTGTMPELLSIYHLLGDPGMAIR